MSRAFTAGTRVGVYEYRQARLSPDGGRVVLSIRDEQHDIHLWDLARETLTRLTFHPGVDESPVWTADGQSIVLGSEQAGETNIFVQAADGTGRARQLTEGSDDQLPAFVAVDWSGVLNWFEELKARAAR